MLIFLAIVRNWKEILGENANDILKMHQGL